MRLLKNVGLVSVEVSVGGIRVDVAVAIGSETGVFTDNSGVRVRIAVVWVVVTSRLGEDDPLQLLIRKTMTHKHAHFKRPNAFTAFPLGCYPRCELNLYLLTATVRYQPPSGFHKDQVKVTIPQFFPTFCLRYLVQTLNSRPGGA